MFHPILPLGVVIRRREAPCKGVGVLEGRGCSDADPEMVRGEGDRRGQLQRIVHGDLGRLLEGRASWSPVDIVVSDDIRDEDTVEDARQSPSEILPVFQVLVSPRTVSRVGQSRAIDGRRNSWRRR